MGLPILGNEQDIEKLIQLKERLQEMRPRVSFVTKDVGQLHKDICSTVRDIFGHKSKEFNEIASVDIEPPSELVKVGEQAMRGIKNVDTSMGETETQIQIAYGNFIKHRFDQLDEYLSAFIYQLRQKGG